MEALRSAETSAIFWQTRQYHIPEDGTPHSHRYEQGFFWRNAPERRSGTNLREQNSKKAKIK
jgi:hypothetical protein